MVNKFDDLLEQFGSNTETLNETVLVDKKYLEEQKRKAKAFDEVIKKVETEFVSEDLADSIRILVNDYEYDMEGK